MLLRLIQLRSEGASCHDDELLHVLRLQQPPVVVIRNGKVLARNELDRSLSVRSA